MKLKNTRKTILLLGFATASSANAGYTFELSEEDKLTFGGFIAVDARYIDGNASSNLVNDDFWIGHAIKDEISSLRMHVDSSRINTKYEHGDVTGYIEFDLFGGGGNEKLTNSRHPRLRHAFIRKGNWTVGQTWSTFVNTGALAEAVDFAGPLVASGFIRQTQIRYTNGNFQFALENPESYGGYTGATGYGAKDALPDVIAKYTVSGDWGSVALAGVVKQLTTTTDESRSAIGYGITGKIKVGAKDDFRFQLHGGNTGRYVGAAAATDLVGEEVEESTAIMVAYRHFWNDTYRSNVFYGNHTTAESDRDRSHWGVNIFKSINKNLTYGFEFGNFEMAEADADSNYIQINAKYSL